MSALIPDPTRPTPLGQRPQPSTSRNVSRQSSVRRRRLDLDIDESPEPPIHPLSVATGGNELDDTDDAASDVSRPTLRRLTSQTERQVAESSRSGAGSQSEGSARGSLDMLTMSQKEPSAEVEVLVHHVKPTESLAGIALLYGIDLPTLRKINKLWASDSVHLRTHLYVPIEACRWNKASETFIRGPGPGQITLVPKSSSSRKGKTPVRSREPSVSGPSTLPPPAGIPPASGSHAPLGSVNGSIDEIEVEHEGWGDLTPSPAKAFMESTNDRYDRESIDSIRPATLTFESDQQAMPEQRIVDVVRIPNSQLRFFPRPQKPPDNERRSLEYDMRRASIEGQVRRSHSMLAPSNHRRTSGPSIQNDLHTLPPPYQPPSSRPTASSKSNMVKIRPTGSSSVGSMSSLVPSISGLAIADKLTSFFNIPPPPEAASSYSHAPSRGINKHRAALSFGGGTGGSRRSSSTSLGETDIPLEMRRAPRRDSRMKVKPNKKLD
ncbi:hypothetical protein DB88DRAFT_376069 [Papiliotrema laurentii]|uniref:LysM domain-containing protein n=1 Tax=Papiliotrema laurentii TaxID=5418 RepID=A0AAD9FNZ6_PAPLA|nr:hypothetical protein DB88DRAFT_376069 [Papiliotrema laurentii]